MSSNLLAFAFCALVLCMSNSKTIMNQRKLQFFSPSRNATFPDGRANHKLDSLLLRVGNTEIGSESKSQISTITVVVSTSFGSSFLDKKKKFLVPNNTTVAELKEQIATKFPGSPPVEIQQLFYNSKFLNNDSQLISNLSVIQPFSILLDTISGTSVYNRTLSIKQALEAYVATVVQQSFIGKKINSIYSPSNDDNSTLKMEAVIYRNMFNALNESIYETYADEIRAALQAERNPETLAADTMAWRGQSRKKVSPLAAALAKEFDLNMRGLTSFLYYSVVLLVCLLFSDCYLINRVMKSACF